MYGKIENNKFIRARYGISEQEALSLGFKPVVLTPAPNVEYGYNATEWLEDTDTQIVRHWNIEPDPPDPDPEIDDSKALEILLGGDAE